MVFQDVRIQLLSDKYRMINEEKGTISGYRVGLFASQESLEARQAKSKFQALFPETRTDLKFQKPFFNLFAGGYRTRLEAEKWLTEFKEAFPDAYIVRGEIKLPDLGLPEEDDPNEKGFRD